MVVLGPGNGCADVLHHVTASARLQTQHVSISCLRRLHLLRLALVPVAALPSHRSHRPLSSRLSPKLPFASPQVPYRRTSDRPLVSPQKQQRAHRLDSRTPPKYHIIEYAASPTFHRTKHTLPFLPSRRSKHDVWTSRPQSCPRYITLVSSSIQTPNVLYLHRRAGLLPA